MRNSQIADDYATRIMKTAFLVSAFKALCARYVICKTASLKFLINIKISNMSIWYFAIIFYFSNWSFLILDEWKALVKCNR